MDEQTYYLYEVDESASGERLDRFLAMREELGCSRSYLKQLIEEGNVRVQGRDVRPSQRLHVGEQVEVYLPPPAPVAATPEDIPLDVLFEDSHLIVVNKPVGMVVHPAPGHYTGTLVNALLHHCHDLSGIGGALRPGIVHRIDRDTSGVLVVAKTDPAHQGLSTLFKFRPKDKIKRVYWAVARGEFHADKDTIDTPYGRHPTKRQCFSSRVQDDERRAITHFRVLERWGIATLLELSLETGRTHQIRVHMADRGRALIGDLMYGGQAPSQWPHFLRDFPRQALHAHSLFFEHPVTHQPIFCSAPLPPDMEMLLQQLRQMASSPKN